MTLVGITSLVLARFPKMLLPWRETHNSAAYCLWDRPALGRMHHIADAAAGGNSPNGGAARCKFTRRFGSFAAVPERWLLLRYGARSVRPGAPSSRENRHRVGVVAARESRYAIGGNDRRRRGRTGLCFDRIAFDLSRALRPAARQVRHVAGRQPRDRPLQRDRLPATAARPDHETARRHELREEIGTHVGSLRHGISSRRFGGGTCGDAHSSGRALWRLVWNVFRASFRRAPS